MPQCFSSYTSPKGLLFSSRSWGNPNYKLTSRVEQWLFLSFSRLLSLFDIFQKYDKDKFSNIIEADIAIYLTVSVSVPKVLALDSLLTIGW